MGGFHIVVNIFEENSLHFPSKKGMIVKYWTVARGDDYAIGKGSGLQMLQGHANSLWFAYF